VKRHVVSAIVLAALIVVLAGCGGGTSGTTTAIPQGLVGTWTLTREGPTQAALGTPETSAVLTIQNNGSLTYTSADGRIAGVLTLNASSRDTIYTGTVRITESTGGEDFPAVGTTTTVEFTLSTDGNTLTMTTNVGTADQWVEEFTAQSGSLAFPAAAAGTWSLNREGPNASSLSTPEEAETLTVQSNGAFSIQSASMQLSGTIQITSLSGSVYSALITITSSSGTDAPPVGAKIPLEIELSSDNNTLTLTVQPGTGDQSVEEYVRQT